MVRSRSGTRPDGWTSGSAWTSRRPTMQCHVGGRWPGMFLWETSAHTSLSSAASRHKNIISLQAKHYCWFELNRFTVNAAFWSGIKTYCSFFRYDWLLSIVIENGSPLSSFVDDTVLVPAVRILSPMAHITLRRITVWKIILLIFTGKIMSNIFEGKKAYKIIDFRVEEVFVII